MIANLTPYSAMKDSGVDWLGEVPEHWNLERGKNLFTKMERPVRDLDEVVTCFRDGTVTLRKKRRTQGFTESLKEIGYQGIRSGDLVIHAMDAFAGAVGVADSDGKGTPVYAVCKPKPNADAHYHAFVIREMARSQWILALATGIRERSTDFRFGTYASQRVPLPPLPEQAAIVRYLDHVDRRVRRLVRAKRKLIALLNEQRQAVIHRAITRGLDPAVRLKDSGVEWLGQVPEHWEVVSLGVAVRSIQTGPFGSQLHAHEYVAGGVPVVNPSHMLDGRINADLSVAVSREKAEVLARHALLAGDVVAARRGELGRCALVTESEAGWLCGTGSLRIRPNSDVLEPTYLVSLLGSQGVRDTLNLSSIGATMDNLNASMVSRLRLPLPLIQEQREIMKSVASSSEIIGSALDSANRVTALLHECRTRLITDVVTGKLDVREAVAALPEVDPLAVDDEPGDALDSDAESDLDELDAALEGADA